MPRPMVQVIQELSTATVSADSPELNTVLVGPCYNVLTYADDKDSILASDAYGEADEASMAAPLTPPSAVTILEADRPGHVTGAEIDAASLNIYLDECFVVVDDSATSGTATVLVGTPNLVTVTGWATDASGYLISAGDRIVLTNGANSAVRTVYRVIDATTLYVTEDLPATLHAAGMAWYAEHELSDVLASPVGTVASEDITVPALQVATYRSASRTVSVAKIYVEYRELRQDLGADISTYSSSVLALAGVGKAVAENPLGLAAALYFSNTTAPLRVLAVDSDDLTGHNAAINVLAARSDVYYIGVLSSDASILASYSTHATQMSQPEVGKFRVAAGGGTLVSVLTVDTGVPTTTTTDYLDYASATFITDGVAVGDSIVLAGTTGNDGTYTVEDVISETRLKVDPAWPAAGSADGTYTITRTLDKQAQTDNLALVPVSFDNKRMYLIWPDSIVVEGVTVDGFFLTAVLGGMVTGLPSHQGFTNIGIAGVDSLYHSNFYFTAAQIDELSDAGWYVFIQESLSGLPFSVHQVSTAQSGLVEEVELNVVKNFDYVSMQLQEALDGFIGRWNINQSTVAVIRQTIESTIANLKAVTYPRLGARLISGNVDSITVSDADSTMLDCYVNIGLPKPLNTLRLHLVSQ